MKYTIPLFWKDCGIKVLLYINFYHPERRYMLTAYSGYMFTLKLSKRMFSGILVYLLLVFTSRVKHFHEKSHIFAFWNLNLDLNQNLSRWPMFFICSFERISHAPNILRIRKKSITKRIHKKTFKFKWYKEQHFPLWHFFTQNWSGQLL